MRPASIKEEVVEAGHNAIVCLYNGDKVDSLDNLRLHKSCEKTPSSTAAVEPRTLPPTSAAAKYHSLRVYHQIQFWMGEALHVPPH